MRVVVDTNVIISAMMWGGRPRLVLGLLVEREWVLLASEEMLAELKRVLNRPKFANRLAAINTTADGLLHDFAALVEVIEAPPIAPTCVDPKDDMFLACALAGQAAVLVSGDHDLLDIQTFGETRIITVDDFLQLDG